MRISKKGKINQTEIEKNCGFIYDKSLINSSFDNFNCFLIEESVPRRRPLDISGITVGFLGILVGIEKYEHFLLEICMWKMYNHCRYIL